MGNQFFWATSGYWEELEARLAALLESSPTMHSWSHGMIVRKGREDGAEGIYSRDHRRRNEGEGALNQDFVES